jgi:hypothetical protein
MNDIARLARNDAMLAQCWPGFATQLRPVLLQLGTEKWRPRVQQAWRSPAEQLLDVAKGVSTVSYGFHNVTGASGGPESLAIDLVDDDSPLSARWRFICRVNELVARAGLMTGILWTPRGGTPLTQVEIARIGNAIATGDWAKVKRSRIGFDSLHVQPVGLKPREAQAGKRPLM